MNPVKNKMENINDFFKLPIFYNADKISLKKNVINDLELTKTIDESCNPIYNYYFNTGSNDITRQLIDQVSEYYTTDRVFLTDNQQLLTKYTNLNTKHTDYDNDYKNIIDIWCELKNDTGFKEKYHYIDWSIFEFLNKSEPFLQFMSLYNLVSPVISLFVPIIILIIPFFIIRLKGLDITLNEYIEVLKVIAESHALGKLFTKFNEVSTNEKMYIVLSAAFYVFSFYQNILICIRFNNNMIKIHKYLKDIQQYLDSTINSMNNYLTYSSKLTSQQEFNCCIQSKIQILSEFKQKIVFISEYKLTNYKKCFEIGHVLKTFYELYDNKLYNDAFMYSFGFNGYIDCIEGLMYNIKERKINFAKFINKNKNTNKIINKNKNTVFEGSYYACLKDSNPIKNTIQLKKNLIITGPNASGKTTVLKSTLINIIFTQQFGCGFYDSAKMNPFKYIHSYLNIPDTSGRDSLFQAEARRCKEILDIINTTNSTDSHFCVFDELYSGTNPEEAVISATAFMEYIIQKKNVTCLLTTHFIKVCKKLKKNKTISNYHMETTKKDNKICYKYLLKEGISVIKGGINVLCDMNYPREIIENTIRTKNK